jgi:hypothetical protein
MRRTAVVTQSNYLPWRGWFDMVRHADVLVLLDSVQYTRRDWRNRNRIKTAQGLQWLTVPVEVKGRYLQTVDETRIAGTGWAAEHLRAIIMAYRRAARFDAEFPWIERALTALADEQLLTTVNESLIRAIMARLAIDRPVLRDGALLPRETLLSLDRSERLAALAEAAGADRYLSGPAAKAYLDPVPFTRRGIELAWMDYEGYPAYPQVSGRFEPAVSVLDLILNTGDAAPGLLGRPLNSSAP